MTRIARIAAAAILLTSLLATASCDSDQPLSVEGQQLDIFFNGFSAVVPKFQVWELTVTDTDGVPLDVNGDGDVDEEDATLWCERSGTGIPKSVPWDYSLKVSVLRAGSAVPEVLTSELAATESGNKAPYDDGVSTFTGGNPSSIIVELGEGFCSNNPDRFCNPAGSGDSCGSGTCVGTGGGGATCSLDPATVCDPDGQAFNVCMVNGWGTCVPTVPPGAFGQCDGAVPAPCDLSVCADAGKGACVVDPGETVTRRFLFNAATKAELTAASRTVIDAGPNTLTDLCTGDATCITKLENEVGGGQPLDPPVGECPGDPAGVLGTPVMDPLTQDINPATTIFGVDLRKGDTIIVEARLSGEIPGGGGVLDFVAFPGLQAIVTVDGIQLQTDEVVGNLTSLNDPGGPAITFSFTSQ